MQIAPRTYWAHRVSAPSKRAPWDTTITEILAGYYEPDADGKPPPESLYGSLKMWAHLQRQGIPVARRTVERIMRANGWRGRPVLAARRAPPSVTRPRPGHRIWWAGTGGLRRRTFWSWPTSPNGRVGPFRHAEATGRWSLRFHRSGRSLAGELLAGDHCM